MARNRASLLRSRRPFFVCSSVLGAVVSPQMPPPLTIFFDSQAEHSCCKCASQLVWDFHVEFECFGPAPIQLIPATRAWFHVAQRYLCCSRVCGSLPVALGCCRHKTFLYRTYPSLRFPLGRPAGIKMNITHGRAISLVCKPGDFTSLPLRSHLVKRPPSDEIPGIPFLRCALLDVKG
jgi:hypothetical protein